MIAIITSCVNPFNEKNTTPKSFFNIQERIGQTKISINQLKKFPFSKIYLLDNSTNFDPNWFHDELEGVIVKHVKQYQFKNKGISEILLLLSLISELPCDQKLFKISGRYYPNQYFDLNFDESLDFKLKSYNFSSRKGTVSTRAYFVRNRILYEEFLLACLSETFSYTKRIVGIRSAAIAIKEFFIPTASTESNTAIEFAAARVLKSRSYSVFHAEKIGIEGNIAGFNTRDLIIE